MNEPQAAKSTAAEDLTHAGFFVLRTPLLPVEEFMTWTSLLKAGNVDNDDPLALEEALLADRALLRERLRQIVARPVVKEALFLASQSVYESLPFWLNDPESPRGQKVERTLVRYFSRMTSRATPFGLFAGCSVGDIGNGAAQTVVSLAEQSAYRRHARLDGSLTTELTEAMENDKVLRRQLRWFRNSSIYNAAGRVRYAEARQGALQNSAGKRSYHLVAVEQSPHLQAALDCARDGATFDELAVAIGNTQHAEGAISREQAEAFVHTLIDNQLLVSDIAPGVTGDEPLAVWRTRLRSMDCGEWAHLLSDVDAAFDGIKNQALGLASSEYLSLAERLRKSPIAAAVDVTKLVQIDLVKPAEVAQLSEAVVKEAARAAWLLKRLSPVGTHPALEKFKQAFRARYEGREVPLLQALDPECGIGFGDMAGFGAEAAPLLADLPLAMPAEDEAAHIKWGKRETLLLGKLTQTLRAGDSEMVIDETDLETLPGSSDPPLALSLLAALVGTPEQLARGEFRLRVDGAYGPSAASLLGRFCHADPELLKRVVALMQDEQALRPEVVFAEIAHLPDGRTGNVVLRPLLRDYEIPYLARSGASIDRQLLPSDLQLSLRGDRLVLSSRRLGREVVPRLTNAHNHSHPRNVGVYRFLCALQYQGAPSGLRWSWGALAQAPFLPRVTAGRLVLSLARWQVEASALRPIFDAKGGERYLQLQKLRLTLGWPRMVTLVDGDNVLPIDLDNILCVESFLALIEERHRVILEETFPSASELAVRGPEGHFASELVIPLLPSRIHKQSPSQDQNAAAHTAKVPLLISKQLEEAPRFSPGSEWLYCKLYSGVATADRVLLEIIRPLVLRLTAQRLIDRWFFIRYGDPDWHLRVRFHGQPEVLSGIVLPALQRAVAPSLADGRVTKLQLDTYEPEWSRYGGAVGMSLSEELFLYTSETALRLLDGLIGDEQSAWRWRLTLCSMAALLNDLLGDNETRRAVIDRAHREFHSEFRLTPMADRRIADRFRKERGVLENLLADLGKPEPVSHPSLIHLQQRSIRWQKTMAALRDAEKKGKLPVSLPVLAGSYLHMEANRLLRSAAREQELLLYDFLSRLLKSQEARQRRAA